MELKKKLRGVYNDRPLFKILSSHEVIREQVRDKRRKGKQERRLREQDYRKQTEQAPLRFLRSGPGPRNLPGTEA